jgi:hypothetical protein
LELEDINPSRGKYTWSNKRNDLGHIAARLDRFMFQSSFLLLGLNAKSKILPFSASDHKTISLEIIKEPPLGPIPFRFSPSWIHHEEFFELVTGVWKDLVTGSPFFVWEEKL